MIYVNNKIIVFFIQEISWIPLYRDIFLNHIDILIFQYRPVLHEIPHKNGLPEGIKYNYSKYTFTSINAHSLDAVPKRATKI